MSDKLSDSLYDLAANIAFAGGGPREANYRLVRTVGPYVLDVLMSAAKVVEAWEDAPCCVVTAADCAGFDDPNKPALADLVGNGKRVKIVEVGDGCG